MQKHPFHIFKWLIPINFILLGIFCYLTVHGHQFLGLICFGIAGRVTQWLILKKEGKHHD